jgi:hypothetical protein
MTLKQLSVFLENKPGALSAPCRLLANAQINIQTFSLADTREFGIMRMIVKDWERAKQLLEAQGFAVKVTDVVALEVPDRPGSLAGILEVLERAAINVEYTYAFTGKRDGKGLLLFRFNNPDAAIQALQAAQVNVLGNVELFQWLES